MVNILTHKRFGALLDTEKVADLNPKSAAFAPRRRTASSLAQFKITQDQYDAMWEAQGGVCAICGKACAMKSVLSVDHDHESGKVRGLLCGKCNIGLGLLGDNLCALLMALEYLMPAAKD